MLWYKDPRDQWTFEVNVRQLMLWIGVRGGVHGLGAEEIQGWETAQLIFTAALSAPADALQSVSSRSSS